MKRWQFWLGILISVASMWYVVSRLEIQRFWVVLQTANYWWLLPGIAIYFLGVWARAWRWHYLLRPIKSITTNEMFPVVTIGYMGNNIYPARAGEVLRAYVLRRRHGVSVSASLATILVERIMDAVVMLMFVFFNLDGLLHLAPGTRAITIWGTVLCCAALAVLVFAAMRPALFLVGYRRYVELRVPLRFRRESAGFIDRFLTGLQSLTSISSVMMVLVTSIVIWLLETGKYYFVMFAFDFEVSFFALMLMNGIVNLATMIPAAPGYVGTFELFGVEVLSSYGVEPTIAAGYTVALHVGLWFPITILGAYLMFREGLSWRKVEAEYRDTSKPTT